ncbi:MAG: transporter substrate-binding domain-containing protein [Deltaproteobacteria bacterium]|nr:transporter substrate-binding domain-containing protein [Deltaproteobacteria bacterium]MBW2393269.1 transporter substrate-binding domain-containing protein [Deltaproteobacteria bacterium]
MNFHRTCPAACLRMGLVLLLALGCASETTPSESRAPLRVGTSGDYAPFSLEAADGSLAGLDVALARAFAEDRGLRLELVRFRWPELQADLEAGRFDLAWSGVTIRPERSLRGRFSVPYLESGAVALVLAGASARRAEDLDRPGRLIAVNLGGHLERVARARFRLASVSPVDGNSNVLAELLEHRADAVITDTLEAAHWIAASDTPLRILGPFTRDYKAVWLRADKPELARDLDRWLIAREADGTLARMRGEAGIARARGSATPAAALEAALIERLSLIPFVAEAKRRSGGPVEVPDRERIVIEAGERAARLAAAEAGAPPLDEAGVSSFYRAQIEASKALQHEILAGPAAAGEPPDLAKEVRPALLRVGEKIAWLLVRAGLPADPWRSTAAGEQPRDEPGQHR